MRRLRRSLVDCCQAFESVLKIICTKREWDFDTKSATAAKLIDVCLANGLISQYWQAHLTGLRSVLVGITTSRNKEAGHGAGARPTHEPPEELVAYVLHMTAATILYLSEAEEKLP